MSRLFIGSDPGAVASEPEPDPSPTASTKRASTEEPGDEAGDPADSGEEPRAVKRGKFKLQKPAPQFFLWVIILFLVQEYIRPAFLTPLKLQMVILVGLPVAWMMAKNKVWSNILTTQVAFLVISIIHIPFADNGFAAYVHSRALYGNVAIAISMAWVLQYPKYFRRAMEAWLLILTYIAAYGLTHGGRGPGGFMGDENDLSLAICTAFPLAYFGFERLGGFRKIVSGFLMILLAVSIVVSFSRGGFVGLAAVGLYCFILSHYKMRNVAVVLAAIVAFFVFAPAEYLEEVKSIADTEGGTAGARRFLWEASVNMWKDNMIWGVGQGGYPFQVGTYQPTGGIYDHPSYVYRSWAGTMAHSIYFQLLPEWGLVGVGLFGYLVFQHFRTLQRLRKDVSHLHPKDPLRIEADMYSGAIEAGMLGYLVAGLFVAVFYYPFLWYMSAFAVALDYNIRGQLEERKYKKRKASKSKRARRERSPATTREALSSP